MENSVIEAMIFDFDGLLADSEPLQIQAWEEFLGRYGKVLEQSLLHEMFGLRVFDSSRLLQRRLNLPISPERVMDERDALFLDLVRSRLPLMPGAIEIVQKLGELEGIAIGLATSGHKRYISAALAVTGLNGAFDSVVTGDDVEHGKPHPEIYELTAQRLGVRPFLCVALEDAPHGVRSAKSAGMKCLAIPNDMTRDIPGFEVADAVIDSLSGVLPWLRERGLLPLQLECDRRPARCGESACPDHGIAESNRGRE